jgi:hypothetical protein
MTVFCACPAHEALGLFTVNGACAGNAETAHVTFLRDLPYDVMELIFANLSSYEVARISTTCSTFQAVCRRHLARVHKSRVDLAAGCFGPERFIFLASIINQFLKGQPFDAEGIVVDKEAKLVLVDKSIYGRFSQYIYQAGDVHVMVDFNDEKNVMSIRLPMRRRSMVCVTIRSYSRIRFTISIVSLGSEEAFGILEGVAFLQGLLSGGFARPCSELGLPAHACMVRYVFDNKFRQEELKTPLIAPLVRMASQYTFVVMGLGQMTMDHMQVKQVGVCARLRDPVRDWSAKRKLHLILYVEPKRQGFFCTFVQHVWSFVEMLVLQALGNASF